ncbi:MarR family winged helix-turn-helix transcriptional regulator [Pseudoroseicyclus aestuarii]|nr:MarR family transcriptional regulator [Pseudoroseicyclus aestuarii]
MSKLTHTQPQPALFISVMRLSRALRQHFDREARANGLTFSRARALSLVGRLPGSTQTELARQMEIEPPSMKRLLDGLEQSGFVTRCPVEGNRRANGVFLTPRAEEQFAGLLGFINTLSEELLADADPADIAAAQRLFDHVLTRFSE